MNSPKTLYFPATDISSIRQYPLFLLFQKIHMIQPVEADPAGTGVSDTFINSGFCQVDTPCPLGPHRDRFLHLVRDIDMRRDDYAGQLKSLSLAELHRSVDPMEGSDQAIIDELLVPTNQSEKDAKRAHEEKLWQARFILALGEILDRQEEEIARNLAILDDDTSGLFKELQGEADGVEDESLFAELQQIEKQLGSSHAGNMEKRLKAWRTLFLESELKDCDVFLTTSRDAGDSLITAYEKTPGHTPLIFSGLRLPGLVATSGEEALGLVKTFAENNDSLLQALQQNLLSLAREENVPGTLDQKRQEFTNLCHQWNVALEKSFTDEEFGRIELSVHIFSGTNCSTLLGAVDYPAPVNGVMVVADF